MKIICCHPALRSFIADLPVSFESGQGVLLYDKRNQVRRFTLPTAPAEGLPTVYIAKRFKHPNLLQNLSYSTFWKNKAEKAYYYAERLLKMGIQTPYPLGALTIKKAFVLIDRYYFVSTENSDPSCWKLLEPDFEDKAQLVKALANYLYTLHEKGFLHGDTNLSNFLWHKGETGEYSFSVIDVNRSTFLDRPATRHEALSNLFRLTHSRSMLEQIVRSYAQIRGWDEQEAIDEVNMALHRFEQKKVFFSHFKKKKFEIAEEA